MSYLKALFDFVYYKHRITLNYSKLIFILILSLRQAVLVVVSADLYSGFSVILVQRTVYFCIM